MKVFVYGTLMQGMQRSMCMQKARFEGLGFINADLYDCGSYPGIRQGNSVTYGELYTLDEHLLAELDAIEGYEEHNLENSLFLRQTVTVNSLHQATSTQAYAYFFNGYLPQEQRIRRGDYRRYLLGKQAAPYWYIAYGSNMSSSRLQERIGDLADQLVTELPGFSLVFNKQGANGSTYANIRYDGAHACCPVVAYQVNTAQLARLDCYEGESVDYIRLGFAFYNPQTQQTELGYVYVAHPEKLTHPPVITDAYLAHIYTGYLEHALDVANLPARNQP